MRESPQEPGDVAHLRVGCDHAQVARGKNRERPSNGVASLVGSLQTTGRRCVGGGQRKASTMLGTILLIVLILVLIGALPTWGYSRSWGYGPRAAASV